MQKQTILIITLLFAFTGFAQDNIQPHWGISFTRGQVFAVPPAYRTNAYPPITSFWKYSATEIYYTFYLKNISLNIGGAYQLSKSLVYLAPKYPGEVIPSTRGGISTYFSLAYHLFPFKKISPYISIGTQNRIKDYNLLIGDAGVRLQPSYTLPLWIGLKIRFARAFYSEAKHIDYPYLDNWGLGLSVQYAFKPRKK